MRKIILSVVIFMLFISPAFAEISFRAEVDKNKITTKDTISYKLTLTSSDRKVPQPDLPKFDGFSVVSQTHSSQVAISRINKIVMLYNFVLAPQRTGTLKIEPSKIRIAGRTYTSEGFQIEVTPSASGPQPKAKKEQSLPEEPAQKSEESQTAL